MSSDHLYASNSAKNLFVRNKDLQSICEREKKLLEWEWQTSHHERQRETAMFKKRAEDLYTRTQDIDLDPKNKRVNLALELKLKTLGQSKFMQAQPKEPTDDQGRAQTSLGTANGIPSTPLPTMEDLRSRSVADMASGNPTNMADLQVPLQHPLLRKRKKDLFARPPPRKWLEARWKAILKRHDREKLQLDTMVEEFIREIEEYKELFRRMCNPDWQNVTQTILNRRVSLRMPVLLGGGAITAHTEPESSVDTTVLPRQHTPQRAGQHQASNSAQLVPKHSVTFDKSETPAAPSHLQLPEVADSAVPKKSARPKTQQKTRLDIPPPQATTILQTPARKNSQTHFPKVSAKRASLATNRAEEKYLSLLQCDSSSQDESESDDVKKTTRRQSKYLAAYPMRDNQNALTLDNEQLVSAFDEFTKGDKSVESMKKMGELATRLKVKVSKANARDRSYAAVIGPHKTVKPFKGLLTQNPHHKGDDSDS